MGRTIERPARPCKSTWGLFRHNGAIHEPNDLHGNTACPHGRAFNDGRGGGARYANWLFVRGHRLSVRRLAAGDPARRGRSPTRDGGFTRGVSRDRPVGGKLRNGVRSAVARRRGPPRCPHYGPGAVVSG